MIRIGPEGGFGSLETADNREIYFHKNSMVASPRCRSVPGGLRRGAGRQGAAGEHSLAVGQTRHAVMASAKAASLKGNPGWEHLLTLRAQGLRAGSIPAACAQSGEINP